VATPGAFGFKKEKEEPAIGGEAYVPEKGIEDRGVGRLTVETPKTDE